MGVSKTIDHILIKIKMPNPSQEPQNPNQRQTKYLIKAELLWANLRQTKYLIKAELVWADPCWAELTDLRLICAELSLFFYFTNCYNFYKNLTVSSQLLIYLTIIIR